MCAAVIVAGAAETASSFQLVDTGITGIYKFNGAALTGDGRVVFAPYNADGVGVFDPTNDIFTLLDISAKISSDIKFLFAAPAGDGRVVFGPFDADGVGVFDPTNDSFTLVNIGDTISMDHKFSGATLVGDGRIVFAPFSADGVGVYSYPLPPALPNCTSCEAKLHGYGLIVDRIVKGECVEG